MNKAAPDFCYPPAEKLQNFFGVFLQFQIGVDIWSRETISKLLRNEKYVGDVLLQKTFVAELFLGKQVKNQGELERFLIQEHHLAIESRELFEIVNPI